MEPRSFSSGVNHDVVYGRHLRLRNSADELQYDTDSASLVRAVNNLETENAELRVQIEHAEQKYIRRPCL